MKSISRLLILGFTGLCLLYLGSCKKTEPCEVIITVKDTLGNPVSGAIVFLHPDSSLSNPQQIKDELYQEVTTGSGGEAYFSFELEAVLDVDVTYLTQYEQDYIRLKEGETARKTIVLD